MIRGHWAEKGVMMLRKVAYAASMYSIQCEKENRIGSIIALEGQPLGSPGRPAAYLPVLTSSRNSARRTNMIFQPGAATQTQTQSCNQAIINPTTRNPPLNSISPPSLHQISPHRSPIRCPSLQISGPQHKQRSRSPYPQSHL